MSDFHILARIGKPCRFRQDLCDRLRTLSLSITFLFIQMFCEHHQIGAYSLMKCKLLSTFFYVTWVEMMKISLLIQSWYWFKKSFDCLEKVEAKASERDWDLVLKMYCSVEFYICFATGRQVKIFVSTFLFSYFYSQASLFGIYVKLKFDWKALCRYTLFYCSYASESLWQRCMTQSQSGHN